MIRKKTTTTDQWAISLLRRKFVQQIEKRKTKSHTLIRITFLKRYYEKLKSEEFNDVDRELKRQVFDFSHRRSNILDASDSWYELSYRSYDQYLESPGEQTLTWKDKGYKTVLDLLQVNGVPNAYLFFPREKKIN